MRDLVHIAADVVALLMSLHRAQENGIAKFEYAVLVMLAIPATGGLINRQSDSRRS